MRRRIATAALARRALAWALAAAGACLPATAFAEGPRILFVAPAGSRWSARVRAEIEALGFTIEAAGAFDAEEASSAVAEARVIEAPSRRVELWTVDAARGRLVLRAVIEISDGEDASTVPVRASEQLRAYLQALRDRVPERASAKDSSPDDVPAAAPARPSKAPPIDGAPPAASAPGAPAPRDVAGPGAGAPASRFSATAAIAVPVQLGRPGLDVVLRGRWMATSILGLGGFVALPLAAAPVETMGGPVDMRAVIFGAELSALLVDTPRVGLSVSAGFAGAWLRTGPSVMTSPPSSAAGAPAMTRSSAGWTGLPLVGIEVAPRLTARLRLHLAGHAGISTAQVNIVEPGGTIGGWGRPLGLFSAGLSFDF